MAIAKFNDKTTAYNSALDGLILLLANGDKVALEQIIKRWNFKDEESFLKFVMAVMLKAENNKLFFQVQGIQTGATPNDDLLKPKNV